MNDVKTRLKSLKLLLLDVDGVLTDGQITYTDTGGQVKQFSSKDGLGIRLLMDAGVQVGIVTGRTSDALLHRCRNLGLTLIFDGVKDKGLALDQIVEKTGFRPEEIGFAGDDLIDLPAMGRAGISFAVADAVPEVRQHAAVVTEACGGKGAVREICEMILKARGEWETVLEKFLS